MVVKWDTTLFPVILLYMNLTSIPPHIARLSQHGWVQGHILVCVSNNLLSINYVSNYSSSLGPLYPVSDTFCIKSTVLAKFLEYWVNLTSASACKTVVQYQILTTSLVHWVLDNDCTSYSFSIKWIWSMLPPHLRLTVGYPERYPLVY